MFNGTIYNNYDIENLYPCATSYYVDLEGNIVKKTPITNPYNFDDYVEWKGNYRHSDSAVYSDRLYQWDTSKYKSCYEHVFKNNGQGFGSKNISDISKFLSMYFEKEIELTAIMRGCNCVSEFPYWIFFYKYVKNIRDFSHGMN